MPRDASLPYFSHFLIKWEGAVRASLLSGCTGSAVSLHPRALTGMDRLCFLTEMGTETKNPFVIFSHNERVTV